MTNIETELIAVLRPGDMVRFIYKPDGDGRMSVSIEGASKDEDQEWLAERMGVIFEAMRGAGYAFNCEEVAVDSPVKNVGLQKQKWATISPQGLETDEVRERALGFGAGGVVSNTNIKIRLPDLPVSPRDGLVDFPASLLAEVPGVRAFEVEFVRKALPGAWVGPLEKALHLQEAGKRTGDGNRAGAPSGLRAFLAQWLSQRSGWRVCVRVCMNAKARLPVAVLETVGREIFGCECEVVLGLGSASCAESCADLANSFPNGWLFPSLLPTAEHRDALTAERLHNVKLPRLPKHGVLVGMVEGKEVRVPNESRDRHTYIVGATGTGKSTLLLRMIREDMERGEGVVLIDPHGDLYEAALAAVPESRRHEVFKLDPVQDAKPPGLNILDLPPGRLQRRHADFMIGELYRFFEEMWDMRSAGGPMFEMYFRNTLLLLCLQSEEAQKDRRPNIQDFAKVMTDEAFRNQLLGHCTDQMVIGFWKDTALKVRGDASLANIAPYISSKVNALIQGGFLAQLLGSEKNEFSLGERMQRNEIILINLNKGWLGTYESRLLGTILMMQLFAAGMERALIPVEKRVPANIYVDEFQNFVSENIASMLSEARKFGLRLNLANQTLGQLRGGVAGRNLLEAVLGNVGNMILFRLGVVDAEQLRLFTEPFSQKDMQTLPNFHAMIRILTKDGPVAPLVMRTLPAEFAKKGSMAGSRVEQ